MRRKPIDFLDDNFLAQVMKDKRGVGVFLPTRAGVEQAAATVRARYPADQRRSSIMAASRSASSVRFSKGSVQKPYLLA